MFREEFPALENNSVAYLDNAATSLLPKDVLDALEDFETGFRSNVSRGIYSWAERATEAYESARSRVCVALDSAQEEVLFTSGTTASLNMAADFVLQREGQGDRKVMVTEMEHHSNIVPWQMRFGGRNGVVWAKCDDTGMLEVEAAEERLRKGDIAAVAIAHASNVTGVVNDIRRIAAAAHDSGALVVVDGAQHLPHTHVKVRRDLDADMYAFSGHKCNGPFGIGVLWCRWELLEELEPTAGGGGMVDTVGDQSTSHLGHPKGFEAGTPNVSGAIGLGKALEWRKRFLDNNLWQEWVQDSRGLDEMVKNELEQIDEAVLYGPSGDVDRMPIRSFNLAGHHPHDVCQVLAEDGVYVRGGHHCAQPLMRRLGIDSCVRVSLGPHVSDGDVERLGRALKKAVMELG